MADIYDVCHICCKQDNSLKISIELTGNFLRSSIEISREVSGHVQGNSMEIPWKCHVSSLDISIELPGKFDINLRTAILFIAYMIT